MRIAIGRHDPALQRALADLLEGAGHEPVPPGAGLEGCGLRIVGADPEPPGPPGCATLVLADPSTRVDEDPRASLEAALEAGSRATWALPLQPALLLSTLGSSPAPDATEAPDLAVAPHPWLLVDPRTAMLVSANPHARALLGWAPEDRERPLATMPLPGELRVRLLERSEGFFPLASRGEQRWASWWTDQGGRRVVCLMRLPGERDAARTRQDHLLAEIGRMTATLAHEIRNPIASLAGAFDLLETESDPADRAEILTMARERLAQMGRLLEQTLLLARPIQGTPEPVDLAALSASVAAALRLDPRFEHVEIEVPPRTPAIQAQAYAEPLQRALTNLLINAAQAQGLRGRVRITLDADARRALLRVCDEGPGVPREKREEVFHPFYTTKESGTGLGLAEVRRAVEASGGAVGVEDAPAGACFCVELPRVI